MDAIRAAGLKLTAQRRAVVEVLAGDKTHPSVESVAERASKFAPGLSLSTVYKVLHELAGLGLVRELRVEGVTRIDPDLEHHMHLVCSSCGTIIDTDVPAQVTDALAQSAGVAGTSTEQIDIVIRGRCAACRD